MALAGRQGEAVASFYKWVVEVQSVGETGQSLLTQTPRSSQPVKTGKTETQAGKQIHVSEAGVGFGGQGPI